MPLSKRKYSRINHWSKDELTQNMLRTARTRTEGIVRECGRGDITLANLAQSCYLQGVADCSQTIFDRYPVESKRMFDEREPSTVLEYM
jgi:hypothetical protein